MNVSLCVQHHPARAHLLAPLLERLGGFELVSDPDPEGYRTALRCYIECLRRTPAEATHRLVLQDDAWPCERFRERAEEIVAAHPDRLIAFFVPGTATLGQAVRIAYRRREWFVELPYSTHFIPSVALCWPRRLIEPYLLYAEDRLRSGEASGRYLQSDDYPVARFLRQIRERAIAPVPSLVEHPDREPSLLGKKHGAGKNKARVAAVITDE